MTQKYGPFAAGAGASLGQDDYLDFLGVMLQGDGVNTTAFGDSTLQVYGNSSGMQVLMRAGSALSRGAMYTNSADVTLTVAASTTSPRIDRVVLRNDRGHAGGGQIYPFVITGTPASSPIPPAITQTPGGVWDITLAQVVVPASASGITPGNVSDERQYLPLRIPVANSGINPPPVDGSRGRFYYDVVSADLLVTNGSRWIAVSAAGFDSNYQAQTVPYHAGFGGYHRIGNQVFVGGVITGTSTSYALFAIAASVAPIAGPLTFPVYTDDLDIYVVATPGGGSVAVPSWAQWGVTIPSAAQATAGTPVTLVSLNGRSPNGHRFEFHVNYPIAGL